MTKHFKVVLFFLFICIGTVQAQSKMVVGKKHTIFVNIPNNWLQVQYEQLAFFIKPDAVNVSDNTYMYLNGLDYSSAPDLDGWIKANNDYLKDQDQNIKIESLNLVFDNLKKGDYETGRYKTVIYIYSNGKKEALLVIECNNTIVTIVMAAENSKEFDKYLPDFIALTKSVKILGTTLKQE